MSRSKSPLSQKDLKKKHNVNKELPFFLPVPHTKKTNPTKLEIAQKERIKELNCLYGISMLIDHYDDSLDDFLLNLVNILPPAWSYPEIAVAQIILQGKTYKSKGFKDSKWKQSSQVFIHNEPVGKVEVLYLKECPPKDEGPFLKEEKTLLGAIAERIGKIARRISTEQELQESNQQLTEEHKVLEETNAALRTVLTRVEEEKQKIYKNVQSNVEKLLMPILNKLSLEVPEKQRNYVDLLKSNLEGLSSPFINHLSRRFLSLTPTEIKICNMIRSGLRTKEIAQMEGLSMATINCHRQHIRQKLEIANKDINLSTFLQSNMWEKEL